MHNLKMWFMDAPRGDVILNQTSKMYSASFLKAITVNLNCRRLLSDRCDVTRSAGDIGFDESVLSFPLVP